MILVWISFQILNLKNRRKKFECKKFQIQFEKWQFPKSVWKNQLKWKLKANESEKKNTKTIYSNLFFRKNQDLLTAVFFQFTQNIKMPSKTLKCVRFSFILFAILMSNSIWKISGKITTKNATWFTVNRWILDHHCQFIRRKKKLSNSIRLV